MLQFPDGSLTALHRALAHDRSPAEAAVLARRLGFESGAGFYEALRGGTDGRDVADESADDFWERLGDFFATTGWGELRFERVHPAVASLSSSSWAEAEPAADAQQPSCHFTTGMLADLLGRVAGADLAVLEVECRSRGDQQCRFLLGGTAALQRIHAALAEGTTFEAAIEDLG
ncbi:MAG TPA: V4R domain-containing protein [Longimicrobiaceae bacterium]|jgi:predicted hydrocarbon binding protein|nr:V4R domain-containing protein [Longimicrobiaceae bacterium]